MHEFESPLKNTSKRGDIEYDIDTSQTATIALTTFMQ